jgi:uncharacterized protein (UPF0212 family)
MAYCTDCGHEYYDVDIGAIVCGQCGATVHQFGVDGQIDVIIERDRAILDALA